MIFSLESSFVFMINSSLFILFLSLSSSELSSSDFFLSFSEIILIFSFVFMLSSLLSSMIIFFSISKFFLFSKSFLFSKKSSGFFLLLSSLLVSFVSLFCDSRATSIRISLPQIFLRFKRTACFTSRQLLNVINAKPFGFFESSKWGIIIL